MKNIFRTEMVRWLICIVLLVAWCWLFVGAVNTNRAQEATFYAQLEEKEQIIQAQADYIRASKAQDEAVADLLALAADTLDDIVYGPYTREEVQDLVERVAEVIRSVNEYLTEEEVGDMSQAIVSSAVAADIDPMLLTAVAVTESGCRPEARGNSGEYGLLQIMPGTGKGIARDLGYENYDLLDVHTNIQFGSYYLSTVTQEFNSREAGLLAYNQGSSWARGYMRNRAPEDYYYVQRVLEVWEWGP